MSIQQEYFKQIADTIRERANINTLIKPKDFANEIHTVYYNGYDNGFQDGDVTGYGNAVKNFWDTYYTNAKQNDGVTNRYAGSNSFYNWYSPMLEWFNPSGTLKITGNAASCFRYFCRDLNTKNGDVAINFKELLESKNCELDTSGVTSSNFLFSEAGISHLPKLDLSKVTGTHNSIFYRSYALKWIDELVINKASTLPSTAFEDCARLEHVMFSGEIGNSLTLEDCSVLDGTSIISLVDTLSSTTTGKTLTLSLIAVKNAFETIEGASDGNTSDTWLSLIATKKNWTITLI